MKISKAELDSLIGSYFLSFEVGVASVYLRFISANQKEIGILLSSQFQTKFLESTYDLDGCDPFSVGMLSSLLTLTVQAVSYYDERGLEIKFDNHAELKLFLRKDGFESYIIFLPGKDGIIF